MSLFTSIIPSCNRTTVSSEEQQKGTGQNCVRSATPAVKPLYKIDETGEAFSLTVQLPGVAKDGLSITAEEGTLVIRGERSWKRPSGWTALYRESADYPFELTLEHDNAVDLDKIHAEIRDGVLQVSLPKTEARNRARSP